MFRSKIYGKDANGYTRQLLVDEEGAIQINIADDGVATEETLQALQAQLPDDLTAGGNLKVAVEEIAPMSSKPAAATAKGYQQLDTLTTAQSLTVPEGATYAYLRAEDKAVRIRDDGTDPTAAVGFPIVAGETMLFTGSLAALRVIETEASAKLSVLFYS